MSSGGYRRVASRSEWASVDLKIKINNLNAIDIIDPFTRASMEKTEDYVKESLEDLKTFQWTPLCFFF